jgi:hypothetical protein
MKKYGSWFQSRGQECQQHTAPKCIDKKSQVYQQVSDAREGQRRALNLGNYSGNYLTDHRAN